jgi:hypothetical protein
MSKVASLALAGILASAAGLGAARVDGPAPERATKVVPPLTEKADDKAGDKK